MKAITIKQPWATLIALGEKRFETRSWQTKYRGELAIHAGKQVDLEACKMPEIRAALARHGFTADNLPTGVIVAICRLQECWQVNRPDWGSRTKPVELFLATGRKQLWAGYVEGNKEVHFGNYESGRYAWELEDVRVTAPIPAKGQLSLWEWEGVPG